MLIAASLGLGLGVLVVNVSDPVGTQRVGRETGLPVPRFVSLKSAPANVRRGPKLQQAIKWIFRRASVPLEVLAEFDHWRKIRDFDGATGWIHQALIGSDRTAWVAPWEGGEVFALRSEPETTASALAFVEPKVLLRVSYCSGGWCSVSAKGAIGHIKQVNLWGVYPHEVIDDRSIF